MSDQKLFEEVCNGWGFELVEQTPEGVYCEGCLVPHKRPAKMYSCDGGKTFYCKHAVLRFYGDSIQS